MKSVKGWRGAEKKNFRRRFKVKVGEGSSQDSLQGGNKTWVPGKNGHTDPRLFLVRNLYRAREGGNGYGYFTIMARSWKERLEWEKVMSWQSGLWRWLTWSSDCTLCSRSEKNVNWYSAISNGHQMAIKLSNDIKWYQMTSNDIKWLLALNLVHNKPN